MEGELQYHVPHPTNLTHHHTKPGPRSTKHNACWDKGSRCIPRSSPRSPCTTLAPHDSTRRIHVPPLLAAMPTDPSLSSTHPPPLHPSPSSTALVPPTPATRHTPPKRSQSVHRRQRAHLGRHRTRQMDAFKVPKGDVGGGGGDVSWMGRAAGQMIKRAGTRNPPHTALLASCITPAPPRFHRMPLLATMPTDPSPCSILLPPLHPSLSSTTLRPPLHPSTHHPSPTNALTRTASTPASPSRSAS